MEIDSIIIHTKDEFGRIDYPIGYIFEIKNIKYIVNNGSRTNLMCSECDMVTGGENCQSLSCSFNRKDKTHVYFKKIT